MSRLHVRLQIQFPYIKVLVLGVLISLLGLGEVVIGILSFTHKIWGHYLGTGLWCGIVIFICGICAIIASQIRGPLCAKLYFATSVVGVLVSFVMLILSSGGLDYDSNFYHLHYNPTKHLKKHNSTVMVHGLALGFSTCSFLANIVSVIICMKYVVFDKKVKYTTERTTRKTTNSLQRSIRGEANDVRSSTNSRAPLADRSARRSRSRRGSDQGSRRRSEAEEFLPGGSRSDSTRRNKNKRHRSRREECRDQAENRTGRDNSNRNEQARNRRNEIPVPVQVERMTIYDGVVQADVVHNDLLPTHFNEDELPPYEEAIRDTYVPVSDLNNQVLSNNAHNESMRTNIGEQIHVCDIDEDKIYQNVNCCNLEENEMQHSAPIIEPQVVVRAGSAREGGSTPRSENSVRDNDVNFNNPSTAVKNKASTKVKSFREERQNETNEEIELYVNQSVVPKQNKRSEKASNAVRDKASLSTSALCDKNDKSRPQTRRCASTASSVSLPPGNPPAKPPRYYSARSDLQDILDSSRSDSSLGITVQKDLISDKTYINVNDENSLPKHSGPKLNMLKGGNSGLDCRNKNSRYKADYIQLQIRQEPEGSSVVCDNVTSDKTGNSFEQVLSHSSPRTSSSTRNSVKTSVSCSHVSDSVQSNDRPKDLGPFLASVSKGTSKNTLTSGLLHQKGHVGKSELKPQVGANVKRASPITPASPSSLEQSGFSPVRFGSPTSAFKPYKREDSSSSSGLTSPVSDSDILNSSTLPLTSVKGVQRQTSWKEFMLPSPHSKTDQHQPIATASDTRKFSAVSQASTSQSPKMSLNTFPRPTPPTFIIPPLSSIRNVSSSGPSTSMAAGSSRVPIQVTTGASPSMHLNREAYVVMPSSSVTTSFGHPLNMASTSSSKFSSPGNNSANINSAHLAESSNTVWSPKTGNVTGASSSLFQPSSRLFTASRDNVMPQSSFRPKGEADAQSSSRLVADVSLQSVNSRAGPRVNTGGLVGAQARPSGPTDAQGPCHVQSLQMDIGQNSDQSPDQRNVSQDQVMAPPLVQQPAQGQVNPSPQQQGPFQQQQQPQQLQQQQQQQQGKPLFSILL